MNTKFFSSSTVLRRLAAASFAQNTLRRTQVKRIFLPMREARLADLGPETTFTRHVMQDMPPPGGYAPIRFRRNMPPKLWKGGMILVFSILVMGFGWYQYFYAYARKKQIEYERYLFTELAMNPFLQAEKDIMLAVERRAFRKKVATLKEVDQVLASDADFKPDWDQFFHIAKRFTYPFNESQRYVNKQNVSVAFKGTGMLENEKKYLHDLREQNEKLKKLLHQQQQ